MENGHSRAVSVQNVPGCKKNKSGEYSGFADIICNLPMLLLRLVLGTADFRAWLADLGQVGTLAGLGLI